MAQTALLAVTAGEPAGIGPDLCLQLARQEQALVVLADKNMLQQRAALLGLNVQLHDYDPQHRSPLPPGHLRVLHVPVAQPVQVGQLNPANSPYVLNLLTRAMQGCQSGEFAGMVTLPVHKGVINDAGIPFTGHTEFLAEKLHAEQVVMMLAGGGLRVALATTHLPLRQVADAITPALLEKVLNVIQRDLVRCFGIARPRILVAGLNPHAGEGGYLGREEIDIMIPVMEKLRAEGFQLQGPLPADTAFIPARLAQCDVIVAMYHDQGLPVLKYSGFDSAVNITLGLPYPRVAVDHGTALDLAGTGRASDESLWQAVRLCRKLALQGATA